MGLTLVVNGLDLHSKLSTYVVTKEISYKKVITTLDNVDHPYPAARKIVISFSLFPLTDEESAELYNALYPMVFMAKFTNPYAARDEQKCVRITSNVESTFALESIDGKRRYKGGTIQLREL